MNRAAITACIAALTRSGIPYEHQECSAELVPTWAKALFLAHRCMGAVGGGYKSFREHAVFLHTRPQCQAVIECAADISVESADLLEIIEDLMASEE